MNTMKLLKLSLAVAAVSLATGCAQLAKDPRDAQWDPKGHRSLMDQIPPWDGAADKLCCQHLKDYNQCRPPRSPRC